MSDQPPGLFALLLGSALAMLASGCAAPSGGGASGATAVATTAAETVVCAREEGTGSRIATTRCRRVADVEFRREQDREMADKIPTVVPDVR